MLQADCLLLHGTVQRTALHFHLVQRLLRMRAQMKHHAQTMARIIQEEEEEVPQLGYCL